MPAADGPSLRAGPAGDSPTIEKAPARHLRSFLATTLELGAAADEVVFATAIKTMPVVSADPYLNKLLISYSDEALSRRPASRSSFRSSVENTIVPLLPHGKGRAGEIAPRFRVKPTNICTAAVVGGPHFFRGFGKVEDRSRRALPDRRKPVGLQNRVAARLPGGQRVHPRVQTLDRQDTSRGSRSNLF